MVWQNMSVHADMFMIQRLAIPILGLHQEQHLRILRRIGYALSAGFQRMRLKSLTNYEWADVVRPFRF